MRPDGSTDESCMQSREVTLHSTQFSNTGHTVSLSADAAVIVPSSLLLPYSLLSLPCLSAAYSPPHFYSLLMLSSLCLDLFPSFPFSLSFLPFPSLLSSLLSFPPSTPGVDRHYVRSLRRHDTRGSITQ
jgi:hypothetical protein